MADWNAERYHEISSPQQAWGLRLLEWLPLAGAEPFHEFITNVCVARRPA